MGRFSKITIDKIEKFQMDAGVLLSDFDVSAGNIVEENLICATAGGFNSICTPTFEDWGADVDNCQNNTKELKRQFAVECKLSFTALNVTPKVIRMALGASDIDAETGNVTPRMKIKPNDFQDVWWVGDTSDGRFVAIRLINALSESGFSLQTTKKGMGRLSVTLKGHSTRADPDKIPMEIYLWNGETTEDDVNATLANGVLYIKNARATMNGNILVFA